MWICRFSLHKSSRFTEWSHLTSVLLLVWAWTWIPRTMRKAEFKRKKKIQISAKSGGYKYLLARRLEVCSEMGSSWLVWMLGADPGPWDIPRLEPEDSVLWRETSRHLPIGDACFLNPQWLPTGSPPKINGPIPFHSYWNGRLSHTFVMLSWDKAWSRQARHQLL